MPRRHPHCPEGQNYYCTSLQRLSVRIMLAFLAFAPLSREVSIDPCSTWWWALTAIPYRGTYRGTFQLEIYYLFE